MIGAGGRAVAILMATLWKGKSVKRSGMGTKNGENRFKRSEKPGEKEKAQHLLDFFLAES